MKNKINSLFLKKLHFPKYKLNKWLFIEFPDNNLRSKSMFIFVIAEFLSVLYNVND